MNWKDPDEVDAYRRELEEDEARERWEAMYGPVGEDCEHEWEEGETSPVDGSGRTIVVRYCVKCDSEQPIGEGSVL